MFGLLQDVRFALRQLRKSPGYTITAVLMLALAIAANSTVFSWIDGTMLHPIPGARDPGRLVSVMRGEWNMSPSPPMSYLDYRDLRDGNQTLEGMLAYNHDWLTLTSDSEPVRIYVANVSSNFFDVLGVKPMLGRFFRPEEEMGEGNIPYVVLSYSMWKTRYASDPAIVGKSIEIARHSVTVIGVAPEGFTGAMPGIRQDAWLTLSPIGLNQWRMTHRNVTWLNVLGRLKPGVSRERANADLDGRMRQIVAAYPDEHVGANMITLDPIWRSPFGANIYLSRSLPFLLGIASVVLLLTCANVATLTLMRFVARRREIAIRQSLGAGRVQLVRQMVLEGMMTSALGGALALLVTGWTARALVLFIPPNSNPITLNGTVDGNVVLAIVVLAAMASILCGALPAWRSSKVPAAEVLKEESASVVGGSHNRRLLSGLVVVQVALSLALLVTSVLLLRTLRNITYADPGFEQDHVLTASVDLSTVGYSKEKQQTLRNTILARASAMPGVKAACLTDWVPFSFTRKTANVYPEGYVPRPHESIEVRHAEVSAQYFEIMGIPILSGRAFAPTDNDKAPSVVIVDQTAAHRYWAGQDPVGQKLMVWGQRFTVVGVARNAKHQFMNEPLEPMIFSSFLQQMEPELIVEVKTTGNPADMAPDLERMIHEVDGQVPVFDVRTLRETTQISAMFAVIESTFAGMFAIIGLVLAATGIYGVVAYRTQLRTHEIGIRVALGASNGDILRLVVMQGAYLTIAGLALGLALALTLTRFVEGMLYGVSANDPATVVLVMAALGAIAVLACYFPARRAMRVSPMTAIREQ